MTEWSLYNYRPQVLLPSIILLEDDNMIVSTEEDAVLLPSIILLEDDSRRI